MHRLQFAFALFVSILAYRGDVTEGYCQSPRSCFRSPIDVHGRRVSFTATEKINHKCRCRPERLHTKISAAYGSSGGEGTSSRSFSVGTNSRRKFIQSSAVVASALIYSVCPETANAGEIGAKINAAVTQSDLGISVRRSVVRGAQVVDRLDGQWEKFSDDFGLGQERSKRDARPKPKKLPEPMPLDDSLARAILTAADSVFLSLVPINADELTKRIYDVDDLVRKSFERSSFSFDDTSPTMTGPKFNFLCYVHFRAYNDLLVEKKVKFAPFRSAFESQLGDKLLGLMGQTAVDGRNDATSRSEKPVILKERLIQSLAAIDNLMKDFVGKGLVVKTERSQVTGEKLDDWSLELSDAQFSLAIDGDVTMNAQILLQEAGFRLYPDFARFALTSVLRRTFGDLKQNVSSEEYYMDTDYNSDPDKFEAKQVLLNVVIDSA